MPQRLWIVRHGYSNITPCEAKSIPGDWAPLSIRRFRDLSEATGAPLGYAPPLLDHLEWGPQHFDFESQRLMRMAYPARLSTDDEATIREYRTVLQAGDGLVFWCHPSLSSCLSILWAVDYLYTLGVDLENASLVLDPNIAPLSYYERDELLARVAQRLPLAEFAPALHRLRRYLASDSPTFEPDFTALPEPVRSWASISGRLADLIPDRRGLDRFDSLILSLLPEKWVSFTRVAGECSISLPSQHWGSHDFLPCRILEMADVTQKAYSWDINKALCQVMAGKSPRGPALKVRITDVGKKVRAGKKRDLGTLFAWRWVGGRRLADFPDLCHSGSYRDGTAADVPPSNEERTGETDDP